VEALVNFPPKKGIFLTMHFIEACLFSTFTKSFGTFTGVAIAFFFCSKIGHKEKPEDKKNVFARCRKVIDPESGRPRKLSTLSGSSMCKSPNGKWSTRKVIDRKLIDTADPVGVAGCLS